MKAHSFEYQLRNAAPPVPSADARVRARRAAVEEFERAQAEQVQSAAAATAAAAAANADRAADSDRPASSDRSRDGFRWWSSRNTLWGGLATACVLVIGVSALWTMDPEERRIDLRLRAGGEVPTPVENPPRAGEPSASTPSSTQTEEPSEQAQPSTQPGGERTGQSSATAQSADSDKNAAVPAAAVVQSPSEEKETSHIDRPAPASRTPPLATGESQTRALESSARAKESAAPASEPSVLTPVRPEVRSDSERTFEEVIVTAERRQERLMESPIALTTITPERDQLEEVQVSGNKVERRRGFRSRKASVKTASASAGPIVVTPPAESRDKFTHFETNPVKRVSDDPVSTFSVDVDTASYAFVRRRLNEGVLPQPDSVRVEEMINYFDYAWPVPESRDVPFKPTVTVSDSPWGEGKKLIHIGIKGYALPARQQPDVNLVLLLDVSGSMAQPDKLPLAQRSMALLLDSLKPSDTVAIVVYASQEGLVLPPTPVREKETILRALNSLQPGGSTAGAAGIRLAYELAEKTFRNEGVNRILLATDGDFNVGITDHNELKGFVQREREKGIFLSVLGFGQGNYRDEMAQTLAQNGNGVAAYIDTLSEAKKVLVQEATASLFTIAKDVKLQVEFNPATVSEYRLVGYETRALNREDFNNDKVDAGDVGSGHTVTAIYEITPVGSKATLVDESRYASERDSDDRRSQLRDDRRADRRGKANEYGFLKIRYKLPNGIRSRLIEQPIGIDTGVPASLEKDVRFSTAVAGFAQLLRGGQYTGSLDFEDVMGQAQRSLGEDPHGYRAEFVQLVRKAEDAPGM